jgi:hypothetical protein
MLSTFGVTCFLHVQGRRLYLVFLSPSSYSEDGGFSRPLITFSKTLHIPEKKNRRQLFKL